MYFTSPIALDKMNTQMAKMAKEFLASDKETVCVIDTMRARLQRLSL